MSEPATPHSFEVPASVDRTRQRALVAGVVGVAAMLLGLFVDTPQFYRSYLVAFIFWSNLGLGCLGLLMVQHLSGGQWGLVIRRLLESGAKCLLLMAVLFLPLLFGLPHVYEWAQPDAVAKDAVLQHKAPFLNVPFWVGRTLFYFVVWGAMALLLSKWSSEQDAAPGRPYDRRFGKLSGPGLVVFGLTVSLASVDWMMSVDPHWFSTIYGFIMIGGGGLSALCFIVLWLAKLSDDAPMAAIVRASHFHDLGKLILAFVMLYAYFTFSQFLIIWSANLPEEIPWYIRRLSGGWQYVMFGLTLLHFALPFVLLLSADLKKSARLLSGVALLVFLARMLDVIFQVAPQFHEGITIHWLDIAALVGVGGLWVTMFAWNLRARPVLPVNDPYFKEAFADHGSH